MHIIYAIYDATRVSHDVLLRVKTNDHEMRLRHFGDVLVQVDIDTIGHNYANKKDSGNVANENKENNSRIGYQSTKQNQ